MSGRWRPVVWAKFDYNVSSAATTISRNIKGSQQQPLCFLASTRRGLICVYQSNSSSLSLSSLRTILSFVFLFFILLLNLLLCPMRQSPLSLFLSSRRVVVVFFPPPFLFLPFWFRFLLPHPSSDWTTTTLRAKIPSDAPVDTPNIEINIFSCCW